MDHLAPIRRDRPVTFDLPKIETVDPKAFHIVRVIVCPSEARAAV